MRHVLAALLALAAALAPHGGGAFRSHDVAGDVAPGQLWQGGAEVAAPAAPVVTAGAAEALTRQLAGVAERQAVAAPKGPGRSLADGPTAIAEATAAAASPGAAEADVAEARAGSSGDGSLARGNGSAEVGRDDCSRGGGRRATPVEEEVRASPAEEEVGKGDAASEGGTVASNESEFLALVDLPNPRMLMPSSKEVLEMGNLLSHHLPEEVVVEVLGFGTVRPWYVEHMENLWNAMLLWLALLQPPLLQARAVLLLVWEFCKKVALNSPPGYSH